MIKGADCPDESIEIRYSGDGLELLDLIDNPHFAQRANYNPGSNLTNAVLLTPQASENVKNSEGCEFTL